MSGWTDTGALVAIGLMLLYWLGMQPDTPPAIAVQPVGAREQWAVDLASRLGNSQPSAAMVARLVEWSIAEDSGDGALARNNPWNTTMCGYNQVGSINGDGACGVGRYATYQDGLDATVATLAQGNFSAITAAIQTDDPDGMLTALIASPWASSHYNGGAGWPHYALQVLPAGAIASNPIAIGGDDCGYNVAVALDANGGALQHVTIAPGETFSFNATMGDPRGLDYRTCAGVPGGNWCNLAARYSQVARALGLDPHFQDHGGDLGAGRENAVTIWNEGGQAGAGQDLLITNTTPQPIRFQAEQQNGSVVIIGSAS